MKRKGVVIALVAVVVLGLVALVILRTGEPRYQGRRLTEWIDDATDARTRHYASLQLERPSGSLTNDSEWRSAKTALKQMAPDAIPWLLKSLQAKDSSLRAKVGFWVNTHAMLHFHLRTAAEYNATAVNGLQVLGPDARPAWPVLIQLTESPDSRLRRRALEGLFKAKPEKDVFLPALLRMLHDSDFDIRYIAMVLLRTDYPQEAAAADLHEFHPGSIVIPPGLREDTD